MSFLVLSLPRSRSAWLARFLTYEKHVCGHDELRHCRSLEDVKTWFTQPDIGTCETAAAPWWRLIEKVAPGARIVTVRRPVEAVVDSLMRFDGFDRPALERTMAYHDRKLDQIEARLPVLSVRFDDLEKEEACAAVFEHCLGSPFDASHWRGLAQVNVQCDLRAMMRYAAAYKPALDKLAAVAKHRTLTAMAVREPVADGMTFQSEDFDTWIADAQKLFDEHLVQVGEAPGQWQAKNIPLMRRIHEIGAMQIMTARSNGRLFGYLMTVIAPSLTSENITSAAHTTFFASPDAPGLGLKLQRAAAQALKDRGVHDVAMQAGVRGSGEKVAAIYKRMGAADDGRMFRLQLAEI